MDVFQQIDSLARQTDQLVDQSRNALTQSVNKVKPSSPDPTDCSRYKGMPDHSKPPQCRTQDIQLTTIDENDSQGTTKESSSKPAGNDSNGSSSGSGKTDPISAGGQSESGYPQTLEAVGQTLTTTWNETILPELKKVDPKVYWGVGGGVLLLLILNSSR